MKTETTHTLPHIRARFRRSYSTDSAGFMHRRTEWESKAKTLCNAEVTDRDFAISSAVRAGKFRESILQYEVCGVCVQVAKAIAQAEAKR